MVDRSSGSASKCTLTYLTRSIKTSSGSSHHVDIFRPHSPQSTLSSAQNLSSHPPPGFSIMVTYDLFMTRAAKRALSYADDNLVQAHRSFDPSTPPSHIKIISTYGSPTHTTDAPHFHCASGDDRRYIRVTINIPEGSRTADEKKAWMGKVMEAMKLYEGSHAADCDIEVFINEMKLENAMSASGNW